MTGPALRALLVAVTITALASCSTPDHHDGLDPCQGVSHTAYGDIVRPGPRPCRLNDYTHPSRRPAPAPYHSAHQKHPAPQANSTPRPTPKPPRNPAASTTHTKKKFR